MSTIDKVRIALVILLSAIALLRTDFSPEIAAYPLLAKEESSPGDLLSQPFRFFGKGRQSFAFLGEDGKTVLKFFNRRYIEMPWHAFLLPWKEREKAKRDLRREFFLHAYPLAAKHLKEETGLLYVHFGRSCGLPPVWLTDRASRVFTVDLNEMPFILQKRGEPLYPTLEAMDRAAKERAILAFLEMIARRISLGIADGDHDVEHNFGVLEGKPIHLDPGRFSLPQEISVEKEWWSATHRFRDWLGEKSPELIPFFDEKRSSIINPRLKQVTNGLSDFPR